MTSYQMGAFFAHVCNSESVLPVKVTDKFWSESVSDLPAGRLVSQLETKTSWPTWEMHPNGDEMILQLSGQIQLLFGTDADHTSLVLQPGQFLVVPMGIWHTANALGTSKALFITQGSGTLTKTRSANDPRLNDN